MHKLYDNWLPMWALHVWKIRYLWIKLWITEKPWKELKCHYEMPPNISHMFKTYQKAWHNKISNLIQFKEVTMQTQNGREIRTSGQILLKDHLLLFDRLEDLDDTSFIVCNIYTFKYLTVFSPSNFPDNLIIILITEHKARKEELEKHS